MNSTASSEAPKPLQVHREEGDLPGRVPESEALIELDAVEDLDRLDATDVLRLQIAMAVTDPALGDPRPEARGLARQEVIHVGPQQQPLLGGPEICGSLGGLREAFVPVLTNRLDRPLLVDPLASPRAGVEARHGRCDGAHLRGLGSARYHELIEHALGGQPAHLHSHLDGWAGAADPDARTGAFERDHPEVGIRSEPPIEAHLLLAEMTALTERSEIQEPEVDGLLDLVHTFPRQEHPRDVGFHQLHTVDLVRVDGRLAKSRDQPRPRSRHYGAQGLVGVPDTAVGR